MNPSSRGIDSSTQLIASQLRLSIVNEFTRWMTVEIHHLVKGGMAPADIKVDTGLARLKPKLVGWTWGSWNALKKKKELITEGWKKCGLGDVLSAAQQVEAMRVCMTAPEEVLGCEPEVAEEVGTDSEGEEVPDVAVDYDAV
jgi:hypothetical protein